MASVGYWCSSDCVDTSGTSGYYRCVQAAFVNGRDATDTLPEIATKLYQEIVGLSGEGQPNRDREQPLG
jgi:hypothetical protein